MSNFHFRYSQAAQHIGVMEYSVKLVYLQHLFSVTIFHVPVMYMYLKINWPGRVSEYQAKNSFRRAYHFCIFVRNDISAQEAPGFSLWIFLVITRILTACNYITSQSIKMFQVKSRPQYVVLIQILTIQEYHLYSDLNCDL